MKYHFSCKTFLGFSLLFTFLILIIVMNIFGLARHAEALEAEQSQPLSSVEIRDYQGEDLSSIIDFRENSIRGPQEVNIDEYELEIFGLVKEPKTFKYSDILENFESYKKVVTLHCVEGWDVNILWEGILINELIGIENVTPEAKTVIFHAYDGYTTSFPVEYILDNDILLAYKMNGVTLPAIRGFPFQLVAESKWGYKWIKWVTKIELSDDENYRGFWESRGYSNEGNLDESFSD